MDLVELAPRTPDVWIVTGACCAVAAAVPALPAPGRLLVEAPPFGAAVVEQDGQVQRIGAWYGTAISPDGAMVAGWRGDQAAVLRLDGTVVWHDRVAPSPSGAQPDWAPDGRRIAYRSGAVVRVGLGTAGRRVAHGLRFAGPRWRPGSARQLAWADRRGRVRLLETTARRTLWRSAPGPPVRPDGLRWSPDGRRLAAISGSQVRVFDAPGRLVRRVRSRRHGRFQTGTFMTGDRPRLVLVQHDFARGRSRVTIAGGRVIFAGRGSLTDVTPSPDGRYLLLGRRTVDEWRFLPLVPNTPTVVVDRVTRRLNPRAGGRWAFPTTRGWASATGR